MTTARTGAEKMLRDQRHREPKRRFFAVFTGARSIAAKSGFYVRSPAQCLRRNTVRAHCGFQIPTLFLKREIEHDQCDSSREPSPEPLVGRDLPWRRKRPFR